MFNSISNYENNLYIQDQEVLGLESIDLSYSNSSSISKILGRSSPFTTISNAVSHQLSISRNLIYYDRIYEYTINKMKLNGNIQYNSISCRFSNAYVTDYSVNCAVGSIPKVSTNFIIYDEIGPGELTTPNNEVTNIFIPNQGSISLSCDNSSTNRIVGFSYAIKINTKPIYVLGSKNASEVVIVSPLEYSASVQVDVDDAFLQNSFNFLSTRQNKTLSFSIKDKTLTNVIQELTIPNASLISETLSSSADGGVKLTLNYIGHQ